MTIYSVRKFTKPFPQRSDSDPIIREMDNLKSAQEVSIKLNSVGSDRFYVKEEVKVL